MSKLPERKQQPLGSPSYHLHGLTLPASALKALEKRGIYCVPGVSVEHQQLAKRYVLRGVESGGAVADMGRACAYISPDGTPIPWLQSIDCHRSQRKTRNHLCGELGQDLDDAGPSHLRTGDHLAQLVGSTRPDPP